MSRPSFIGQILGGRYRIDEILGQGGMSAVYKAYDPNLKRVVAIKLIHAHLANDPKFIVRFEEEASAVAQLRHPHIVQVYDFNHDGELYYMVQEFVPGETLQMRLRRLNQSGRRMPVEEAAQYATQIAEAAGYAHQRGMVHRDIKPANIMLDVQGKAILMDFGIVKILGGTQHTATGAVVGTAQYLPPELIRGETPDPRSDIYSLGVTLFEMVSGRPPFEADSAMTLMMMHLNDPLPDLRALRPEVPEHLIAVVERCLQKDRNLRYASMAELANALRRVFTTSQAQLSQSATLVEPSPSVDTFRIPARGKVASEGALPVSAELPSTPRSSAIERAANLGNAAPASRNLTSSSSGGAARGTGEMTGPPSGALPTVGAAIAKKSVPPIYLVAGGALILLILVGMLAVGGLVILPRLLSAGGAGQAGGGVLPTSIQQVSSTATQAVALALSISDTPTPSSQPSETSTPTVAPSPTETPTPTLVPSPTIPLGVPFVRINGITVDEQKRYVVEYETFEFTEKLPGVHVHFFFDTVPAEQAGMPGKGPWILYGGPRPFKGYRTVDRPPNAAQLCALVANPNHSVQSESGNCFILPDIPAAFIVREAVCRSGPALEFPEAARLEVRQVLLLRGISPDESWWFAANPQKKDELCWISTQDATVSGNISALPLIEPPPLPSEAAGPNLFVEITRITIDSQNRYAVEYVTRGFTEKLPGTHIHFFFNNVSPEQVGIDGGGSRRMYGGPSPFTGYRANERPAEATQLCALVANPDHSVLLNSGNCFTLPDVQAP